MLVGRMDGLDSSAIPIHISYLERSAAATASVHSEHPLCTPQAARANEDDVRPDTTSGEEDIL